MPEKDFELKYVGGFIEECKEESRNGQPVGIVEGYIATWDRDTGRDRFVKGCFAESIANHQERRDRQVRLKDHHYDTVGGFPISSVKEDRRGLFGRGEVNLNVRKGSELYALARQGVLVDFSVGFSALDFSFEEEDERITRIITKAKLWEGSVVDEPMNQQAHITAVKKRAQESGLVSVEDVKEWTVREFENALCESGHFSKGAARWLAKRYREEETTDDALLEVEDEEKRLTIASLADDLRAMSADLRERAGL